MVNTELILEKPSYCTHKLNLCIQLTRNVYIIRLNKNIFCVSDNMKMLTNVDV